MRRESDFFGDEELSLVYIARRLRDALALEKSLTDSGIDYLVETDTYMGGIIFRAERVGAFFYVAPSNLDSTRAFITSHGYQPYNPHG